MNNFLHPSVLSTSALLALAMNAVAQADVPTVDAACKNFSSQLEAYKAKIIEINHPTVLEDSIGPTPPPPSSNPRGASDTLPNCRTAFTDVIALWASLAKNSETQCILINGKLTINTHTLPIVPGARAEILKQYDYHTDIASGIHQEIEKSKAMNGAHDRLIQHCIAPIKDSNEARQITLKTLQLSKLYEQAAEELKAAVADALSNISISEADKLSAQAIDAEYLSDSGAPAEDTVTPKSSSVPAELSPNMIASKDDEKSEVSAEAYTPTGANNMEAPPPAEAAAPTDSEGAADTLKYEAPPAPATVSPQIPAAGISPSTVGGPSITNPFPSSSARTPVTGGPSASGSFLNPLLLTLGGAAVITGVVMATQGGDDKKTHGRKKISGKDKPDAVVTSPRR